MAGLDFSALELDTLVLDWDGTLFRSFPAVIEAYKVISREMAGRELDVKWFKQIYSTDYIQNLRALGIPDSRAKESGQLFFENFEPATDSCRLFPGVERVIKGLAEQFPKMGIYTVSRRAQLIKHLRKNHLERFFQVLIGYDDLLERDEKGPLIKPHPHGLQLALKKLGSKPERTAYIGDGIIDYKTGRNAKVALVGLCTYGDFEKPEFLRALNADMYFEEPSQLLQLGEFQGKCCLIIIKTLF